MSQPTYDPYKLIKEVQELLNAKGFDTKAVDGGLALAGAGQLLRAHGIFPAGDMSHALDNVWSESDM